MRAKADECPDQPERHEDREERKLATDHRAQRLQIEPGDCREHDDRRAQRAVGDRRGVGDQREPCRGERLEAEPHHDRGSHRHRRPEAGRAFEECAEAERRPAAAAGGGRS